MTQGEKEFSGFIEYEANFSVSGLTLVLLNDQIAVILA
jgi:hypothetical protein